MSLWNKAVPVGERCILELPLNYTKHDHDVLDKIFWVANNMKNNLISWYDRQLTEMTRTRAWRDNQKSLSNLYSEYADDVEDLEKGKQRIAKKKENAKKKKKTFYLSRKDKEQLRYLQSRVKEFEEKRKDLCQQPAAKQSLAGA